MDRAALLAGAALVTAAVYWYMNQGDFTSSTDGADDGGSAPTAGDDASNILEDGIETMKSMINNWPTGSGVYQDMITAAAASTGVPVEIAAWLFWKESRYIPDVIYGRTRSRVGALGIAQFMPATAVERLGSVDAALDPQRAIPGAMSYLRSLYDSTGSWTGALAAYNWGIGNVKRKGLAAAPAETTDYYTTILARANGTGGTYA